MSSKPIPGPYRPRRIRARLALTLASVFVLVAAPAVQAANATNINVQLPAGFSIAGTIRDTAGAVLPDANSFAFGRTASAYGSTDSTGSAPKDRPLGPGDLLASIYRVLGINHDSTVRDRQNRPIPILASGQPIAELF